MEMNHDEPRSTRPSRQKQRATDRRTPPVPDRYQRAVYKALSLAIDRPLLVEVGYGKAGKVILRSGSLPLQCSPSGDMRLLQPRISKAPRLCWTKPAGL
jgi:hypothetical protein